MITPSSSGAALVFPIELIRGLADGRISPADLIPVLEAIIWPPL
jgi:hypothetical protein